MARRAACSSKGNTNSSFPPNKPRLSAGISIARTDTHWRCKPNSSRAFLYKGFQRLAMVMMEKFSPNIKALSIDTLPGPTTGMRNTERRAATPESLMVSMHTASKPSCSARQPASKMDTSANTKSWWLA